MILLEAVNLVLLMSNNTVIELIMNFLALVIISEFDDFFFLSVRREPAGELIASGKIETGGKKRHLANILTVETTSSDFADHLVQGNLL